MRPVLIAAAAIVATAPCIARGAQPAPNDLGYDYLRAGYVSQQSDYFNDGAHGYGIAGSWLLGKHVYIVADAEHLDFNRLAGSQQIVGAGVGYQENPMGDISAFLQAELFHAHADTAPGHPDGQTDGYARFSWGFRTLITKRSPWEIDGAVYDESHTDFGSRHFGLWLGVGAVWDHFGVRFVGDHNTKQETLRVELTWNF
jgi:hypothetical protein